MLSSEYTEMILSGTSQISARLFRNVKKVIGIRHDNSSSLSFHLLLIAIQFTLADSVIFLNISAFAFCERIEIQTTSLIQHNGLKVATRRVYKTVSSSQVFLAPGDPSELYLREYRLRTEGRPVVDCPLFA